MEPDDAPQDGGEPMLEEIVITGPDAGGGGVVISGSRSERPGGPMFGMTPDVGEIGAVRNPIPDATDPDADGFVFQPQPEIIITAPRMDQAHYAADGDVFNDGRAPAYDTVEAWLDNLFAQREVRSYVLFPDPNDPDRFTGRYVRDGDHHEIRSDGARDYADFLRSSDYSPPWDDGWSASPGNQPFHELHMF